MDEEVKRTTGHTYHNWSRENMYLLGIERVHRRHVLQTVGNAYALAFLCGHLH